jgi:hypothetical protein
VYPVDLTLDQTAYFLENDEAVLIQDSYGLLKINNESYTTRRSFRTPGNIMKSCCTILQSILKENARYTYNGKSIPVSNETKIADAIEMCKFMYPQQYHKTITMLHIILEHVRVKLPDFIMSEYANKTWRNNIRVQQICTQAFGYAKRMNNQGVPTMQQINLNIQHLIAKENYQSLAKLNEYYNIEKFAF